MKTADQASLGNLKCTPVMGAVMANKLCGMPEVFTTSIGEGSGIGNSLFAINRSDIKQAAGIMYLSWLSDTEMRSIIDNC